MKNTPIRIELPTIFGMKTVNSFLFKEPEPILIDCGENSTESWDALNKGLNDNGLKLSDIKKIYITHMHIDHVGMAGRIAAEHGTEIWVNDKSVSRVLNYIEFSKHIKKMTISITSKLWGIDPNDANNPMLSASKSQGKTRDTWTGIPESNLNVYNTGDLLRFGEEDWEAIYMPGHSDTQTIFLQRESKKVLSADMLLSVTPTPFYELSEGLTGERIKGLPIMMQSYQKLLGLDFSVVYPGHYDVIHNPKEIAQKQVDHIHKRKIQCFEFIKSGNDSYDKLYPLMYEKFTLTAITMLVGYLDLLVEEENIRWIEDEKAIRFEVI
jgi:glyoxylase-like metal-dependent hydrolase (beta-lactamase superfamily II)